MKLKDISFYVSDRATKKELSLRTYVTTDTLYPNKEGRKIAGCLPSTAGSLTKYAKNDVLISNIRPYLKKIWFSDAEGACNNDVLVFRAKENISPEFLYSFLLQDQFFSHVMRGAKGSKMPRGDREQIMDFEAPAPLSIEKEIGTFIANIKRKIDLLREINRNLLQAV